MKCFITILFLSSLLHSQGMFEPVNSDIYDFLETMSIKGIIRFNDEVKPLTRIELAKKILETEVNVSQLTYTEKSLLEFYKLDFEHEIKLMTNNFTAGAKPRFIITDADKRIRFFEYAGKDFSLFADPMLSASIQSAAGENLFVRRNGFSFYGYALDNWAFSFNFYDNEETGNNLDINKNLTPERGVSVTKIKPNAFEYDFVNASAGYYWSTGSISIGKEYFNFGSGRNSSIILSDKAPSFPFIRIDFKPIEWLRFFYFHGFLISNVPDSSTFRYNKVPGS